MNASKNSQTKRVRPNLATLDEIDVERAPKVGDSAARRLAEYIVSNSIPIGTSLPPEKELAESLGIGRGTMREALRLLETFGLVEMRTGRYGGAVVRRPDARDLGVSLTLAFYANGASMWDVLDARLAMEPTLARMAARRITSEDLEALRETVRNMRDQLEIQDRFTAEAHRFHEIVFRAAEAPILSYLCSGLEKITGITYAPPERLGTASAHEAIIKALDARDSDLAADLWEAHLTDAGEHWRRQFPERAANSVQWTL